jgi:hypothetical protein
MNRMDDMPESSATDATSASGTRPARKLTPDQTAFAIARAARREEWQMQARLTRLLDRLSDAETTFWCSLETSPSPGCSASAEAFSAACPASW